MRKVKIGAQTERFIEIREGLDVNEQVLIGVPEDDMQ